MKTKMKSYTATTSAALLTLALLAPVTASSAPGTLADTPLFLSNSVEPNVLFMLDDSGSMSWGMMTTESEGIMNLDCPYYFVQPDPAFPVDEFWVLPTEAALVDAGIAAPYGGVWRGWNKDYNRIYYDPSITYVPWSGMDSGGAPFANASPTAALYNPFAPGDGSTNLTVDTSYDTDYCPGALATVTVSNFFPARYNIWIDSDADGVVDDTDAHTLVEIKPTTLTSRIKKLGIERSV